VLVLALIDPTICASRASTLDHTLDDARPTVGSPWSQWTSLEAAPLRVSNAESTAFEAERNRSPQCVLRRA
jgi:hypothetical protein